MKSHAIKLDNASLMQKVALRRRLIDEMNERGIDPVVMETHGGEGVLYRYLYSNLPAGIVMEKDPDKVATLSRDRSEWGVYRCHCDVGLRVGIGKGWGVNLVDIDSYGHPWGHLEALLEGDRDWPDTLGIAFTDGIKHMLILQRAWKIKQLQDKVDKYGNDYIYKNYLSITREHVEEKIAERGYTLDDWSGFYTGREKMLTFYSAICVR